MSWTFNQGVRFVGLHISFPINGTDKGVEILRKVLALEELLSFKRIKFSSLKNEPKVVPFSPEQFDSVIRCISARETNYLDLMPDSGPDWAKSYEKHIAVHWAAGVLPVDRPLSPVERRFGLSGTVDVTYPISRFATDVESSFQSRLLNLLKTLVPAQEIQWAFVHQGLRPVQPFSVGTDDVFLQSRDSYPLSSFDADLYAFARYSKEFVKGAFWANFLNKIHIEKLGGIDHVLEEKPCSVIERIGEGRVLLQVGRSPLPSNPALAVADYQRLRRFLKPILLETHEERAAVHKQTIGSWTLAAAKQLLKEKP